MIPVLRGKLGIKNDHWEWSGKWSMTVEEFKQKKTSKFKYRGPEKTQGDDSVATAAGNFSGFFYVKNDTEGEEDTKVKEKNVAFTFTKPEVSGEKWSVEGKGQNRYGTFVLDGHFNPFNGIMLVTKRYEDSDNAGGSDSDGSADFHGKDEVDDEEGMDDSCEPLNAAEELKGLQEDNELTVEELRAKYGGGGGAGDSSGAVANTTSDIVENENKEVTDESSDATKKRTLANGAPTEPVSKRPKRRGTEEDGSEAQLRVFVEDLREATNPSIATESQAKREEWHQKAMKLLSKLRKFEMTVDLMLATGIGKLVNRLAKKNPDLNISHTSSRLIKDWRKMASDVQKSKR